MHNSVTLALQVESQWPAEARNNTSIDTLIATRVSANMCTAEEPSKALGAEGDPLSMPG